jgi:hypothetical protein
VAVMSVLSALLSIGEDVVLGCDSIKIKVCLPPAVSFLFAVERAIQTGNPRRFYLFTWQKGYTKKVFSSLYA